MMKSKVRSNLFRKVTLESLVRYMEGSGSKDENQLIGDWIQADPQHFDFFTRIKEAWLSVEDIDALRKENIEKDWNNILMQIRETEDHTRMQPAGITAGRAIRIWIRVAAVILMIVTVTGAYFVGKSRQALPVAGREIMYNEILVPKGQQSQVILADGSKIWLNAESKFRFPDRFDENAREVWLEGEAFFVVARNKHNPFYVHTSDLSIKVHGTSFNVKAYPEDDIIETTLVEGSVSFETQNASGESRKEVYLKPNHKAIYIKKETSLITEEIKREVTEPLELRKIIISEPVEVEPVISWTEGKLVFTDETFDNIAIKLERKYNVRISIDDESIKNVRYTGVLKNVSIEQALKAIQLTTNIRYTIDENMISISEKE